MNLRRISHVIASLCTAAALLGCGTDEPGEKVISCTENTDCEPGYYCGADDKCVQDCDPSSSEPGCPDGESCDASGRCVVEGECIDDSDCDTPPEEPACDGQTLVAYSEVGSCVTENGENVCEYQEARTPCENDCQGGNCVPDPCEQILCNTPPADVCAADGTTLISFADPGQCSQGVCQYAEIQMNCAVGCAAGACLSGGCDDQDCDTPPSDACENNTAVRYADTGVCVDDDGMPYCNYEIEFEACDYTGATCNNAQCENPITQVGGVVIVEYMANPAGSFNDLAEWFEIVNVSGAAIDLNGWKLRSDGDDEHVIDGAPMFEAGARLVFAFSSTVPFVPDYNYADVRLANNTDSLELVNDSDEVVDRIFYEPGAILDGRSRKLDPSVAQDVMANDDFSNWCPSMGDEYTQDPSNYGTPGAPNTACAPDPCAGFTCEAPRGYCLDDDNLAVQYVGDDVMCRETRFNNPFCEFDTVEVECADGDELCVFGVCEPIPDNVPAAGEVIITEYMPDPDGVDTDREWLEVYNTTGGELSLFSTILVNDTGANTRDFQFLDPAIVVGANEYLVFVRDLDPTVNGGVDGDFEFSPGNLVNGASGEGLLKLTTHTGDLIDEAYYANDSAGASMQLDPGALDAASNDSAENWCPGMTSYGDGGDGTPGAPNEACP